MIRFVLFCSGFVFLRGSYALFSRENVPRNYTNPVEITQNRSLPPNRLTPSKLTANARQHFGVRWPVSALVPLRPVAATVVRNVDLFGRQVAQDESAD